MHELSIVKDIFTTLEENYQAKVEDIVKIEITAGLLSNVQPILIQNAFNAFLQDNVQKYKDMDLEVVVQDIVAHCKVCQKDFKVEYHRFVCPCGEPSSTIVQGDELFISKVIFKQS
ncbi:hydrogenase maturation nickel metallochaperone HypA/HybF [Myroides sp. LJL115]